MTSLQIAPNLTHPIKLGKLILTELKNGFGAPVKQLWTTWTTPRICTSYNEPSWSSKIGSEIAVSNSTFVRIRSNTCQIQSILTHLIKTWQPHSNLELQNGFGAPVNQLWTTWTTPRTFKMLQLSTSTLKIGSWTVGFELDITQKGQERSLDR